jgi:tRNA1Val (adenine37-N6)-methyltransferase
MSNSYFKFKKFVINQDKCAMKVSTDACIFGAIIPTIESNNKVLDIGSGTGLLSLMTAQKNNNLLIDAIEIVPEAAQQSIENYSSSSFKNNISLINEDIRYFEPTYKYDVIITNPPFFENDLNANNYATNLAKHSLSLSLLELAQAIKKNISTDGTVYLLFPTSRVQECSLLFEKFDLYLIKLINIQHTILHQSKNSILQFSGVQMPLIQETFIIKNESKVYTDAMKKLMKDYYLK